MIRDKHGFHHECQTPRMRVGGRLWKCPVCRRVWKIRGTSASSAIAEEAVIVSVTMRYPDGSEQTFS